MLQVSIYRYNPEIDAEPYMQDVQVETGGKDLMVLDVMELIKAEDETVVYRRSCREGVCGSDGVNMNGTNGLACVTPLSKAVRKKQAGAASFAGSAGHSRLSGRYEPVLCTV